MCQLNCYLPLHFEIAWDILAAINLKVSKPGLFQVFIHPTILVWCIKDLSKIALQMAVVLKFQHVKCKGHLGVFFTSWCRKPSCPDCEENLHHNLGLGVIQASGVTIVYLPSPGHSRQAGAEMSPHKLYEKTFQRKIKKGIPKLGTASQDGYLYHGEILPGSLRVTWCYWGCFCQRA